MVDERLVHTDSVHDGVGWFYKMAVDGGEKDKVAIAWLHGKVSSGVYFTEHNFSSTSTSFVSTLLVISMDPLVELLVNTSCHFDFKLPK